jgi:hypothetical protein
MCFLLLRILKVNPDRLSTQDTFSIRTRSCIESSIKAGSVVIASTISADTFGENPAGKEERKFEGEKSCRGEIFVCQSDEKLLRHED